MTIATIPFGSTGHLSTRCIFGGTALSRASQEEADRTLEVLLQYGINHIDTAAGYGDSELRIGPWMRSHRDRFFLATKTGERSADGARAQLERSLQRLQVDHVDMIQLHSLTEPDEWRQALGKGGALEALIQARDEGLARNIGITGHGVTVARSHREALERHPFDAVLLPLNYPMHQIPEYAADFDELRELCRRRGVAVQTIRRSPAAAGPAPRAPTPPGTNRWPASATSTPPCTGARPRGRVSEHGRRHEPAAAHPGRRSALPGRGRRPAPHGSR